MSAAGLFRAFIKAFGGLLFALGVLIVGYSFISAMSYAVNGTELVHSTVLLACFGAMPMLIGALMIDIGMELEDG